MAKTRMDKTGMTSRRGGAIVEFTLASTFIFVPILAGLGTVGFSLVRGMEAASLNSSAGQMFSSGVDFSQQTNQGTLAMVAGNLKLSTAGDTVVILSEIQGMSGGGSVCTRQLVMGNSSLRGSSYVNPSSRALDSSGDVTNLNDPSAQLGTSFTSMISLGAGETVFLAETYVKNGLYAFNSNGTGIYMMNIF